MSTLKAFVGHSFTEEDEDVVRKFLDYFSQIQNMGIGFSWEHAREAEPKVLAEKVLKLIEDKNLFIGICTKKEKVINQNKLKSKFLSKSEQCGNVDDFDWKTSDWIIQEIGLAIGRGMDIMLLVEEGLRAPGGFQGNLEYIQFNRQTPGDSFGRILEMIRALLPHAKPIDEAIAGMPKPAEEKEEKEEGDEWVNPKPEWKRQNYEHALMHIIAKEDKDGEQKIDDAYLETEEGKEENNIDSWVATREYLHILLSKDGSLGRLEMLSKEKPENSEVQKYLAKAYQHFDEEEKAAKVFSIAAENETDNKQAILMLGYAARAFARANKKTELNELICKVKEKSSLIEEGEIELLKCLIDIADIQDNKTLSLAYAERLLDLKPDDYDSRFNLAYGHSDNDRRNLSLFHYLKIPYRNRNAIAWNNLGVEYSKLDIDGKSVDAYRKSEEMNETLAMDNLARSFLEAGFFEEAKDLCEKAKKLEDYNKNVDDTSFKLKKKQEEEEEKTNEVLERVKPIHEFFVKYGRAAAKENISNLNGSWEGSRCQLNLEIYNGKFKAYGTYEVASLGLIMGALGGAEEKPKYEILYEGEITGYAIKGTVTINELGKKKKATTLLTKDEDAKDVLMMISDDVLKISVYQESATYETQRFQEIKKITK